VPGRACELADFLVDCFGALIGSLLFSLLNSVSKRNAGRKKAAGN
jgi:VanZ family protein